METSHLGLRAPGSLPLSPLSSCGSLYWFPPPAGGRVSDDGFEYNTDLWKQQNNVVILLLHPFSRTVVFGFPLGLSGLRFLATQALSGMVSISWSGP